MSGSNGKVGIFDPETGEDAVIEGGALRVTGAVTIPSGGSTSAKQLADGHNVTVLNPTANPETGLAKTVDITKALAPTGTDYDNSVTMTSANTAYALPASAPTSPYVLIIYNTSTTGTIYIRKTTGTTLGVTPIAPGGSMEIEVGANKTLFAYSSTAGVVVNCSYTEY